jgi:regulator of chromosome condensation
VLNIYVCGEGESGELGLGAFPSADGKKPYGVRRPRLNAHLTAFDPVQVAAGGMHAVVLGGKGQVVTWGVNDDGALGRETGKGSPRRKVAGSRSESSDSDGIELNSHEATPKEVNQMYFKDGKVVKVVALDSACFALTDTGKLYGWGTFKVCYSSKVHLALKLSE